MFLSNHKGFTLLEILIALFIFTILSMMMVNGLRHVITVQTTTEDNAKRLRQTQIALLLLSRDIEQAVNRPVKNASNKEEGAFIGTPKEFTLTHTGFANPTGAVAHSSLQRSQYVWKNNELVRITWSAVDLAPGTKMHVRSLLHNVSDMRFEYLDKESQFRNQWPVQGQTKQGLPRAVRITMEITNWGTLSQLYVIPMQPIKTSTKQNDNV